MINPDLNQLRKAAAVAKQDDQLAGISEAAEDKWWDPLCQMCTPNPLWVMTGRVARIHAQERHRERGG